MTGSRLLEGSIPSWSIARIKDSYTLFKLLIEFLSGVFGMLAQVVRAAKSILLPLVVISITNNKQDYKHY